MGIGDDMERAWESLQAGWRSLMDKAANALTRFRPGDGEDDEQAIAIRRGSPGWSMLAAEMRETPGAVKVRIEVPGMDADQFDIEVRGRQLQVRGEKHYARESDDGRYHIMERAYGSFERSLPLPCEVDDTKATASYKRGVLTVTLPKHRTVENQRIEVKGG